MALSGTQNRPLHKTAPDAVERPHPSPADCVYISTVSGLEFRSFGPALPPGGRQQRGHQERVIRGLLRSPGLAQTVSVPVSRSARLEDQLGLEGIKAYYIT